MYQSPIDICMDRKNILTDQLEDGALRAVANVGINVEKDEMLKALQYDRQQYEQGYHDGYSSGYEAALKDVREKLLGNLMDSFDKAVLEGLGDESS